MKVKVIEMFKECQSDVGAPAPKIIADEHTVNLFYYLQQKNINLGDGLDIHIRNDNDLGIIHFIFSQYKQFKFGAPNDEAISGHPYYKYGLKPYSISMIENSDWIDFLEKQNAVHPYHRKESYKDLKHYVFFFHDRCFEIVCSKYEYKRIDDLRQKEIIKSTIDKLV